MVDMQEERRAGGARRGRRATRTARLGLAGALAVGGVGLAPGPSAASADSPRATIARVAAGHVDADVRGAGGRPVGHLRASVHASGRAAGVFRPHHGSDHAAEVAQVTARATRSGVRLRVGGADGMRLTLTLRADGRLRGAGSIDGRRVTVVGHGGEELPDLERGKAMLVVGRPRGEGYRAMRGLYRPVRLDADRHTAGRLLRRRADLHRFAAIVFGPDVSARQVRRHPLLARFFGTGKWVAAAPASPAVQSALGELHGHDPRSATLPAFALRASGPEGEQDRVRPAVAFPAPIDRTATRPEVVGQARDGAPAAPARRVELTAEQQRRLTRERARWYRSQLVRLGAGHLHHGDGSTGKARAAASSASIEIPERAAALQIVVPFRHEFVLTGAHNLTALTPCAQNTTTHMTWCPGSWYFKQVAGDDWEKGCAEFLRMGYRILPWVAVRDYNDRKTAKTGVRPQPINGAWKVDLGIGDYDSAEYGVVMGLEGWRGNTCPKTGTQIGNIQGNDHYYVLYDHGTEEHSVVVLTDPTVSAVSSGGLWRDGSTTTPATKFNGNVRRCSPVFGSIYSCKNVDMWESAWYLGSYRHDLSLSGPGLASADVLEYSSSQSFPTKAIEFVNETQSVMENQTFKVGIWGDGEQLKYTKTVTTTSSVSVSVPNWEVLPQAGTHTASYLWTTNRPMTWDDITFPYPNGTRKTWALNDLNRSSLAPASASTWEGSATWGLVEVDAKRQLQFVDHFTFWESQTQEFQEGFAITAKTFGDDNPNSTTPNTPVPTGSKYVVGPGLNLCDPVVRAEKFTAQCGGA